MDIGTAKPTSEERAKAPHSMIDLIEPEDEMTVAEFQRLARKGISEWDGPVVIAGGSGLHFRGIVDPLEFPPCDAEIRNDLEKADLAELVQELLDSDPLAGENTDLRNPRRVIRSVEILRLTGETPSSRARQGSARQVKEYRSVYDLRVVGIDPGERIQDRIRARLKKMRDMGLLDEVAGLVGHLGRTASQAVGYKELVDVVAGRITEDEGFARVEAASIALVKRQRTFFRRDPRIMWVLNAREALDALRPV